MKKYDFYGSKGYNALNDSIYGIAYIIGFPFLILIIGFFIAARVGNKNFPVMPIVAVLVPIAFVVGIVLHINDKNRVPGVTLLDGFLEIECSSLFEETRYFKRYFSIVHYDDIGYVERIRGRYIANIHVTTGARFVRGIYEMFSVSKCEEYVGGSSVNGYIKLVLKDGKAACFAIENADGFIKEIYKRIPADE